MANTFQSITSGLAELKNFYEGPIKEQFNNDLPLLRGAEKVKKGWSGYQVVRPIRTKRHTGIGAVSDGGTLPTIGTIGVSQALIASKFNYLRFGVTGPMIKASQSDVGSFVRDAAYQLEMGYKDLKSDVNRQLSWDGTSDLAVVSANAIASNVITVTGRESPEDGNKFLDTSMIIDIVTTAGAYKAQNVSITAISGTATATLTLSAPVTVSATDVVIRAGSLNNEIQGLIYSLDGGTSTIYNIDRTLATQYQGNSNNLAGAQLTLDALQKSWNDGKRRGDAKYGGAYMDFDSLRFYQKLLTADKRYVNSMKGDGGFASAEEYFLEFNGVAMVPDKDCPQRIFFLDRDALKNYVLCDLEFCDETGSMYIAQVSADVFEVRIRYFTNLFNEQPAACAVLKSYISP